MNPCSLPRILRARARGGHPSALFFPRTAARLAAAGILLGIALGNAAMAADEPLVIKSPDGKIAVSVNYGGEHLSYSILFRDKQVISPSEIGVSVNGEDMGKAPKANGQPAFSKIDEQYPNRGLHPVAVNRCNAVAVPLTSGSDNTPWQLELRVFNDAVAYRYLVPGTNGRIVNGESSSWNIPAGTTVWCQDASNRSYESKYHPVEIEKMAEKAQINAPATLQFPGDLGFGMITEANLVNYCDMDLQFVGGTNLHSYFVPNPVGWTQRGDLVSPWRVTILAADLNTLVNTDAIKNLCPPAPADAAQQKWIRPGRSIWHWLTGGAPKLEEQHDWIDGTSKLGYEFYLVDDGWRDWNGGGDNAWKALEDLVRYARSKNVDLWAWVHARYVFKPEDREAYFKKAKQIGLVGLKLDFPDSTNRSWVQWYDDVLRDAYRHQLMIDFHGALKPTGRDRTWPHEMTREAIAGREQGKNSAVHDTALPFIRYVQGHADYTPTLLQASRLDGSSYAHELAMAIVYTSEYLCMGDNPRNYLNSTAVDLIKALPAVWDETMVLPGSEIGKTAALARRSGKNWFVGIINGPEQQGSVALSFLGSGSYKLIELADDPQKEAAFVRSERTVTNKDTLKFPMRTDGGYVAQLIKL